MASVSIHGSTRIAFASGRKPRDERWTELAIYFFDDGRAHPFVAEIVGETTVGGEERRVRRAEFERMNNALVWGAFNMGSALYGELRRKAMSWLESERTVSVRTDDEPFEKAIGLLRELVEAANGGDDDRLDRAINAASEFLEGIGDAPRS